MSKQKWEVKTHEEVPNWGVGDYDEYYEVVNERGDAIQTTDNFDNLHVIADALNSFDGELRITTALEINLHCDNQMLKMELEQSLLLYNNQTATIMKLQAENSKMRNALEEIAQKYADAEVMDDIGQFVFEMGELATEALK